MLKQPEKRKRKQRRHAEPTYLYPVNILVDHEMNEVLERQVRREGNSIAMLVRRALAAELYRKTGHVFQDFEEEENEQ